MPVVQPIDIYMYMYMYTMSMVQPLPVLSEEFLSETEKAWSRICVCMERSKPLHLSWRGSARVCVRWTVMGSGGVCISCKCGLWSTVVKLRSSMCQPHSLAQYTLQVVIRLLCSPLYSKLRRPEWYLHYNISQCLSTHTEL